MHVNNNDSLSRMIPCTTCDRTGRLENGATCPECRGKGAIPSSRVIAAHPRTPTNGVPPTSPPNRGGATHPATWQPVARRDQPPARDRSGLWWLLAIPLTLLALGIVWGWRSGAAATFINNPSFSQTQSQSQGQTQTNGATATPGGAGIGGTNPTATRVTA
ncbi:MAG: hypothetical protein H0X24_19380, partial [Ktedonobacterales bacterium]|nr:hypothetical protein [Ktedonobacterales bacterium]